MPSSHPGELTVEPVSRHEYLLQALTAVPDPCKPRGRRHRLSALVAVAVCAVLAGARSFTAIGQWAADTTTHTLTALGMNRGPADEATFRRAFARLDADQLDRVLGTWAATRVALVDGRHVISLDGKTLRGARTGTGRAPHLVAALCVTTNLGQVGVDAKSNEIPAARDLIDLLDIDGAVLTLDAMHTPDRHRRHDSRRGRPLRLHRQGQQQTNACTPSSRTCPGSTCRPTPPCDTGHGRSQTRTIKTAEVPAWIEFEQAAQVAQLRRTTWRKKSKGSPKRRSVEVVYLVTSAHQRPPAHRATADPGRMGPPALGHREEAPPRA